MSKYEVTFSSKFKKQYKKLSIKNRRLTDEILLKLGNDETLDKKHNDHALSGNMKGFRDCHILPDLVLIYEKYEDIMILRAVRVGNHSGLF